MSPSVPRSEGGTPPAPPRTIALTVNGKRFSAAAEPRKSLADFLREEIGAAGTRVGCEHGVCGSCTVLLDGDPVRSCLVLAVQADGQEVTTVEGLADGDRLHPTQQAFWEEHGLQCGYCTGGILMSLYELLSRSDDPSEAEIHETLGGHLCRCTGYEQIVSSAKRAVALMRQA